MGWHGDLEDGKPKEPKEPMGVVSGTVTIDGKLYRLSLTIQSVYFDRKDTPVISTEIKWFGNTQQLIAVCKDATLKPIDAAMEGEL